MDVRSPGGQLLRSVPGKHSSSSSSSSSSASDRYLFVVHVEPTLDSIGTNVIAFRYQPVNGAAIELANFDSAYEELFEDASVLNYTVAAQLAMVDVREEPAHDAYYYGNEISFVFKVKDLISGKYIKNKNRISGVVETTKEEIKQEEGSEIKEEEEKIVESQSTTITQQQQQQQQQANIYLSLEHKDENRPKPFVSAFEPAVREVGTDEEVFVIRWAINPNAVHGVGSLTVSAQDADGNSVALYKDGKKKRICEI